MPDDAMRHIRLFEIGDILGSQPDGARADGIFQVRNLRGSDDRRGHGFLLQQPGQRNVYAEDALFCREFRDPRHDLLISFGGCIVLTFLDLIGF